MTIFLAHAPEDAVWAERIRRMIGRTREAVAVSREPERPLEEVLAGADGLVVLLSAEYSTGGMVETGWWLWHRPDKTAAVLHLDDSAVPASLATFEYVAIEGLAADALRSAVSGAVVVASTEPAKRSELRADEDLFRLPRPNPDFHERSTLLNSLRSRLKDHGIVVLRGPNGIGKTDIAIAFAHRCQPTEVVCWIDARSEEAVKARLLAIVRELGLCGPRATAPDALRALRRGGKHPILLIFDDVRSDKVFRWMPGGATHVVATTESDGADEAYTLEVPTFTRAESIGFILRHLPSFDADEADDLAASSGDHPGRLKHSVAVRRTRTRRKTDAFRVGLAEAVTSQPPGYKASAPTQSSWLAQKRGESFKLTRMCAAMKAAPVPLRLIQTAIRMDEADHLRVATGLHRLVQFGEDAVRMELGTVQPNTLRNALDAWREEVLLTPPDDEAVLRKQRERFAKVHALDLVNGSFELDRSVRGEILSRQTPSEAESARDLAESMLIRSKPESLYDPAKWQLWPGLELLVLPPSEPPGDPRFHDFINALFASRLARAGASKVSDDLAKFYAAVRLAAADRKETVATEELLARCDYGMGKLDSASSRAETVWFRRKQALGTTKRQTLEAMLDLALYKCELGKTFEADYLLGEADKYIEACTGEDSEVLVRRLRYVQALVLHKEKKYQKALERYDEILAVEELQVRRGPEFYRSRMQRAYCQIGLQNEQAVQLFEGLLAELRFVLEPEHEDLVAVEKGLALARKRAERRPRADG